MSLPLVCPQAQLKVCQWPGEIPFQREDKFLILGNQDSRITFPLGTS